MAALVYEALLLSALAVILGFILLPFTLPPSATIADDGLIPLPTTLARLATFTAVFVLWGAYCVRLWSDGRRSLPMRTWRISLRDSAGGSVTARAAAARYLACWIGPACAVGAYLVLRRFDHGAWAAALLGLNFGWALVDRDHQFLHDRIAGTRLVSDRWTPAIASRV